MKVVRLLPGSQVFFSMKLMPGGASRNRPINPKAYELYLRGRYYFNSLQVERAAASFSESIQLEPKYAQAYAGLAESYARFEMQNAASAQEAMPKAKAAALRALELDPSVAEAHTSLGWAKLNYDWDWNGAEDEFRLARTLNPSYEIAPFWYGCELTWAGNFDRGLNEMKVAGEMAPASAVIHAFWGMALYQARRNQEAIERLKLAIQLDSTLPASYTWLGLTYLTMGRGDEAIEALEKGVQLSRLRHLRMSAALSRLGYGYGVTHRTKQAEQVLKQLNAMSATQYISPVHFAIVYVGVGDKDRAFYWLERGVAERTFEMTLINVDPRFDSLRSDARFQNLLKEVNFPPRNDTGH